MKTDPNDFKSTNDYSGSGQRTMLPERSIDYREKYLNHLDSEDYGHVMKCISLAALEGKLSTLKMLYQTKARITLDYKGYIKEVKEQLSTMCKTLKIFYEKSE